MVGAGVGVEVGTGVAVGVDVGVGVGVAVGSGVEVDSTVVEVVPVVLSVAWDPQEDKDKAMVINKEYTNKLFFFIKISIPPPSAGGTNSNESVSTLYVML